MQSHVIGSLFPTFRDNFEEDFWDILTIGDETAALYPTAGQPIAE
jgi:hypothetical protein